MAFPFFIPIFCYYYFITEINLILWNYLASFGLLIKLAFLKIALFNLALINLNLLNMGLRNLVSNLFLRNPLFHFTFINQSLIMEHYLAQFLLIHIHLIHLIHLIHPMNLKWVILHFFYHLLFIIIVNLMFFLQLNNNI